MLKKRWFQWFIWGIGVVSLLLLNSSFFESVNERVKAQNYQIFLDITHEAELDIKNKLRFYEEILWGGVGLFNASNEVERSEWIAYVDALDLERYPGINGVGYIESVRSEDLEEFLDKAREDYPGYDRKTVGDIVADDHLMILYIEPEGKNLTAVGLDIGSETYRRTAAFRARDTGRAVMTEPIVLVQDEQQNPGFLMLLPIYDHELESPTLAERRKSFVGWIYAAFIAKNFLQDTLHTSGYLGFSVTSGGRNPLLIYSQDEDLLTEDSFISRREISLGDTTWEIQWWSKPGLSTRLSSFALPQLSLLLGILLTAFVAFVSGFLIYRDQKNRRQNLELQSSFDESESKFTEAFENAAIGIALVSLEGHFLRVNKSLCTMIGYSKEDLIKKTFQDITHPDDLELDLSYIRRIIEGKLKTYTLEKRYFHKKGHNIWVRLNVSLVRDSSNNPKFFVSEIEDITRTKLLDSIKSDFVSITSHQFRTPLSGMRWNVESLLDGGLKKYAARKTKMILQDVLESILRMNELVKDLLRVSKIESGLVNAQLRSVDIKKAVRTVNKELKVFADKKQQKIVVRRIQEPIIAHADEGFVSEVLKIVVHNAIIYAPENSDIVLEFQVKKQYFYLHIENEGGRIPPREQKRLYEKFSRLQHGVQKNPNGSGLGLFIARNLLELMGGDIRYDKDLTDRIRFTIKLPKAKD